MTFEQDDTLAPYLEPGHHAYWIIQDGQRRGFVASAPVNSKRVWYAYRPRPLRTDPWGILCIVGTRAEAARRLVAA